MTSSRLFVAVVLCASSFILVGCSNSSAPTVPQAGAVVTPPADSEAMLVSLKSADQLDGKEDHVIGKCYVCALGMDGKPEHSAEFQGYTAHLCSEGCCNHFKEHPEQVISETKIPGGVAAK